MYHTQLWDEALAVLQWYPVNVYLQTSCRGSKKYPVYAKGEQDNCVMPQNVNLPTVAPESSIPSMVYNSRICLSPYG